MLVPPKVAEAEAQQKLLRAVAHKRFVTAAAVGLIAVGLAAAWWLFMQSPAERPSAASEGLAEQSPFSGIPEAPEQTPNSGGNHSEIPGFGEPRGKVTTDYNVFRNRLISALGKSWNLHAGHHYTSNTQEVWDYAWCYLTKSVEGIDVRLSLAQRSSTSAKPVGPISPVETIEKLSLTVAESLALATNCPWLDGKEFTVYDFSPHPNHDNPFSNRKPKLQLSGSVLRYTGQITTDFVELISKHNFNVLEIDSAGGIVQAALKGGRWLRANGKDTVMVRSCLSACVYLVAGGVKRSAESSAKIGVHQFRPSTRLPSEVANSAAQNVGIDISRYLVEMGVDRAVWESTRGVPPNQFKYVTHAQARQWKLINADSGTKDEPVVSVPDGYLPATDLRLPEGSRLENRYNQITSFSVCQNMCTADDACKAITYNTQYQVCFLKRAIGQVIRNMPQASSWIKPVSNVERKSDGVPYFGQWAAQVGSFSTFQAAEALLNRIQITLPTQEFVRTGDVKEINDVAGSSFTSEFKVMFSPLTEAEARQYCGTLKSNNFDCFPVPLT